MTPLPDALVGVFSPTFTIICNYPNGRENLPGSEMVPLVLLEKKRSKAKSFGGFDLQQIEIKLQV